MRVAAQHRVSADLYSREAENGIWTETGGERQSVEKRGIGRERRERESKAKTTERG